MSKTGTRMSKQDGDLLLSHLGDLMEASASYEDEPEAFRDALDPKHFSSHQPTRIKQMIAKIEQMKKRRRPR